MGLKDYWYIAAESRELKQKPVAVAPFEEHIVLFRTVFGDLPMSVR